MNITEAKKRCACGHQAWTHPTQQVQDIYVRSTGGRYSKECKGAEVEHPGVWIPHCRCTFTSEEVVEMLHAEELSNMVEAEKGLYR